MLAVIALAFLAVSANGHPAAVHEVEAHAPARIGVTAPLSSNERVLVKNVHVGPAGATGRSEKVNDATSGRV